MDHGITVADAAEAVIVTATNCFSAEQPRAAAACSECLVPPSPVDRYVRR
jgi:hypothetical protein